MTSLLCFPGHLYTFDYKYYLALQGHLRDLHSLQAGEHIEISVSDDVKKEIGSVPKGKAKIN